MTNPPSNTLSSPSTALPPILNFPVSKCATLPPLPQGMVDHVQEAALPVFSLTPPKASSRKLTPLISPPQPPSPETTLFSAHSKPIERKFLPALPSPLHRSFSAASLQQEKSVPPFASLSLPSLSSSSKASVLYESKSALPAPPVRPRSLTLPPLPPSHRPLQSRIPVELLPKFYRVGMTIGIKGYPNKYTIEKIEGTNLHITDSLKKFAVKLNHPGIYPWIPFSYNGLVFAHSRDTNNQFYGFGKMSCLYDDPLGQELPDDKKPFMKVTFRDIDELGFPDSAVDRKMVWPIEDESHEREVIEALFPLFQNRRFYDMDTRNTIFLGFDLTNKK